MRILPLSDSALIIYLGDSIDPAVNRRVHALTAALMHAPLPGLIETTPGYASLTLHYDPLALTHTQVVDWLTARVEAFTAADSRPPRRLDIPVTYDGPDLPTVAARCGLSVAEVIRLHSQTEYSVYMMGFLPGFAYLGVLPAPLRLPRLPTPRLRVPAGAVGIAGAQTGIYPLESPGGWHLIGRTDTQPFDPRRDPPFLFAPGDVVRFIPYAQPDPHA